MFERDWADFPGGTPPRQPVIMSREEQAIIVDALRDALDEALGAADHLAGADDPARRAQGRIADDRARAVRALLIKLGAPEDCWSWFPLAPDAVPDGLA